MTYCLKYAIYKWFNRILNVKLKLIDKKIRQIPLNPVLSLTNLTNGRAYE